MSRLTSVLPVLYGAAALYLAHCATSSWRNGSQPYAAGLAACSLLLVTALLHHQHTRAALYDTRADLERASRPFVTAQDTNVARLMTTPCCEAWWAAVGGPHHCTKKDQTT